MVFPRQPEPEVGKERSLGKEAKKGSPGRGRGPQKVQGSELPGGGVKQGGAAVSLKHPREVQKMLLFLPTPNPSATAL